MMDRTADPGLTLPPPMPPVPSAARGRRPPPNTPLRFIGGYLLRRCKAFAVLGLLIVGAAGASVAVQVGMKMIVDTMAAGDRGSPAIWHGLGLFVGLIAFESVLWRLAGWLGCRTIVATGVEVRLDLFRHLADHPISYFSGHLAGALGGRITATAGAMGSLLGALTWKILPPIVDFLGAVVVLTTINGAMALSLVGFVLLVSVGVLLFGMRGRPLHQAFAEQNSRVNGELVDVVANIWTVKAFSGASREARRLEDLFGGEAKAQRRSWLYLEKVRVLHDLLLWLLAGHMLVWAILGWRAGRSTPGDVVVISALTFRVLHGSRDLALAMVDAAQQFGVIGEMLRVIVVRHQVPDLPGAVRFEPRGGSIALRRVDFAYGQGATVLQDFDLEIPAGQRCGVVGPSGAGKSTLLALLQRLDDVQGGSLQIDGQDVRTVRQASLRASIAVVPQDTSLLHRTVLDNIRYGRPHASDAEVVDAARAAGCDDFIRALPQGYRTIVGERGALLSGGQRQRIGIARALLKQAPILLLDEATSALDSDAERRIEHALDRLMRGRTVVAVAHRLSTLSRFDRIVVLEHGRIVEDGTPAELQAAGGVYARLWRMQSEGQPTT